MEQESALTGLENELLAFRRQKQRRFIVIYDGACLICRFSVNFLSRIDFLSRFSYLSIQEISSTRNVKIPISMLQESIHVFDTERGVMSKSMQAISKLLIQSPPALPIYVLVMFLRSIGIAESLYTWIAASRYMLSSLMDS